MKYYVFVVALFITTARCGIIERGFDTLGEAANIAHEGIGDMYHTGKDILFGQGVGAGLGPSEQGVIPGLVHKVGDGVHLFGDGISHVFGGEDDIHAPLSEMKNKVADAAGATAANAGAAVPNAAAAVANAGAAVAGV